jgi:NAD kinase
MNRERTRQKLREMSSEDLAWVESQIQEVKREKSSQKTRNYTLKEKKAVYTPRPKARECIELLGGDGAALAAASLHTFFDNSFAKHHPGDFPENFYDE